MLPDLLLIDGGKGQVRQALDVLDELGIEGVPVVGVAKGEARRAGDETLICRATPAAASGRARNRRPRT